jgi:hypothetical protein
MCPRWQDRFPDVGSEPVDLQGADEPMGDRLASTGSRTAGSRRVLVEYRLDEARVHSRPRALTRRPALLPSSEPSTTTGARLVSALLNRLRRIWRNLAGSPTQVIVQAPLTGEQISIRFGARSDPPTRRSYGFASAADERTYDRAPSGPLLCSATVSVFDPEARRRNHRVSRGPLIISPAFTSAR